MALLDPFAERIVLELKGVIDVDQAKKIACDILDDGDFQGNVPELKEAVNRMNNIDDITMLMWRAASNGLEFKHRYG